MTIDPQALAHDIQATVRALPKRDTPSIRAVRKDYTSRLKSVSPTDMLSLAHALIDTGEFTYRWMAYELIHHHKPTLHSLGREELEALGQGMDRWEAVDTFAPYLSGPAWREGQIGDEVIHQWARSEDLWWRRTALVSTIALNVKARGGAGDVPRTLAVCRLLAPDTEDMVVKAMSWALRSLVAHDVKAVEVFLVEHDEILAARVKREVHHKLETGLKTPRRS